MPHSDNKIDYDVGDLVYLKYLSWNDKDFKKLYGLEFDFKSTIEDCQIGLVLNISTRWQIDVLINERVISSTNARNWAKFSHEAIVIRKFQVGGPAVVKSL